MDSTENTPIRNAHVINLTTFRGTTSDVNGFFIISAKTEDTLLIQTIDYDKLKIAVSAIDTMRINLYKRTYDIREVKVGILGNYRQFKQMVLSYDPDKDKVKIPGLPEPKHRDIPLMADEEYWKKIGRISSPVTYIYQNFSKHAKSVYKAHDLEKQNQEQLRADAKFNRELVRQITGMKNENEISNFILFCNFTHDYIMNTQEYQICNMIKLKYQKFKRQKSEK